MNRIELIRAMRSMDRLGIYVFTRGDLAKLFPAESEKTLEKSLARMVASDLIVRASKAIYVNPDARSASTWVIEDVALALRRGHYSYVSLESALAEHGIISQVPMRLTVMTTGASGTYDTAYGTIEFTHTRRSIRDLLQRSIKDPRRPLRIALKRAAVQDLLRVGRNQNMLDEDELSQMQAEESLASTTPAYRHGALADCRTPLVDQDKLYENSLGPGRAAQTQQSCLRPAPPR